ncbi:MAG: DUF4279 domain-containing protein [Acidobacteriota bacterium]
MAIEIKVSFRIMGHDIEPREISHLLGLEPTMSHKRGDVRIGRTAERYSAYSEGLWSWCPDTAKTAPLADHLRALIDALEAKEEALRQLRGMGLRTDVFIGVFGSDGNFGFALNSEVLERLGQLRVALDFDIYDVYAVS